MTNKRIDFMRKEAITCIELLKGFDSLDNSQQAIDDLSNYILELTQTLKELKEKL